MYQDFRHPGVSLCELEAPFAGDIAADPEAQMERLYVHLVVAQQMTPHWDAFLCRNRIFLEGQSRSRTIQTIIIVVLAMPSVRYTIAIGLSKCTVDCVQVGEVYALEDPGT